MKHSILIKLYALAALLLYVASSVGINVHTCDCTGHVCAHIALYLDDIHDNHHDSHHCGHEDVCGHGNHHHGCCHNKVYRVAIAGDNEDDGVQHINAVQFPAFFCRLSVCMPDATRCRQHIPDTPPPVSSHSGNIFILRV